MHNNQENWDKMTVLILCQIQDLGTKRAILEESGISLPEILERMEKFGRIWSKEHSNVNGHDLTKLKLPINEWLNSSSFGKDNVFLGDVIDAFRVMKINYVFQMYAYEATKRRPFMVAFKENFSGEQTVMARLFFDNCRESSKIPPIESIVFNEGMLFWIGKTWGM